MAREIELKFDCVPGCADRLTDAHGEPKLRDQCAIYYDTKAEDLRKAGYSLRIRRSGNRFTQTIKLDAESSAGMFDRQEWESAVHGFELDFAELDRTPLGKRLKPGVRRKLVPLIRTEVCRSLWTIDRNGSEIQLTLDEGEILSGTRSAPIAEIELELLRGEPAALFDLAEEIAALTTLRLGVLSKAERGYALARDSLGKVAKSKPVRLDKTMTAAQGFAAIAYACLRHFRLNEGLLLEEPEAAALHQARVAMRRLRSAFSLFRSVIADENLNDLREELRWFTGQLGAARNIDVFTHRLDEATGCDELNPNIRARLSEAREEAYSRVLTALDSDRFRRLMLGLIRWIEIGPWRSRPKAQKPLAAFGPRQLDKRWHKVKSEGASLRDLDEESRHRLRIDIKKLRYSAEFFAGLQPSKAAERDRGKFLGASETLQEELGALNDAVTARMLIADLKLKANEAQALERLIVRSSDHSRNLAASDKAYHRLLKHADYWA